MEHKRTYIEELIRKQLLGQLTAEEAKALVSEKSRYSDEEYDRMLVEVLRQLEGQLPKGLWSEWTPDYAGIRRIGDRIRRRRKWKHWSSVIQSAALLLLVLGMVGYFFVFRYKARDVLRFDADCAHLAADMDIPVSESACTISWGDSIRFKVDTDAAGEVYRIGQLRISRTGDGALRLQRRIGHTDTGATDAKEIVIHTGPREQCVVHLEEGTVIRLNAQSYLRYPLVRKGSLQLGFGGEAHVQTRHGDTGKVLELRTRQGKVIAKDAEFAVKSTQGETKALLREGEVDLFGQGEGNTLALRCPYDLGGIRTIPTAQAGVVRDTLIAAQGIDFKSAIAWTKVVRRYENIPLRAFVEEMSRWEGFTIKDWRCIPEDKVITATVCYRNDREQVFAVIRNVGVRLWVKEGMLSFCPEDTKNWGGLGGTSSQLADK